MSLAEQEQRDRIRAFLAQHIRSIDLKDDEDIFQSGFVNSLFAMRLVLFIESEFGVTIEREDLILENFRTINAMAALVERKRDSAAAG